MSSIGLVLGAGGISGASFHFGALFGLRMATGWEPGDADVIVGTSSGALVAALARCDRLSLDALIGDVGGEDEMISTLRDRVYRRTRPSGVGRWVRHGLMPGMRRPGLTLALGSPARFSTAGIEEWIRDVLGDAASGWPTRPTTIVSYEIESRSRVAFGTDSSPDTDLATAVAASSAVPLLFEPVTIAGKRYVDGGVASGTSADLVLGSPTPLDLVVVVAPMASTEARPDARFYEGVLDRVGGSALTAELQAIRDAWPNTEFVVLRPDASVLAAARPNPLDVAAALPTFLATLRSMRSTLASPDVWPILERHIVTSERPPLGRRLRALLGNTAV